MVAQHPIQIPKELASRIMMDTILIEGHDSICTTSKDSVRPWAAIFGLARNREKEIYQVALPIFLILN
jgi:hypothetical protein